MSKPVISVRNLGKRYLLGTGGGERYRAIRDVIANSFKNIFRKIHPRDSTKELWALKGLSFDVHRGEKIGIIGRNGAGKSTLLKLISGITEPTEGEICLRGRVASLLEVGMGFHPELTGKENIFMNAAILGMTKAEIKRKYNEIVSFAEVEKFIDTPVKRYSSGMYVRLAFAVAAHLESEILIIDEVLAVGDAAFQKKCLGKMEDATREGRTVLIVSHNMPIILNLCQRAILLDKGKIVRDGESMDIVKHYLEMARSGNGEVVWPDLVNAPGNDIVRLHSARMLQEGIEGPTADIDISKDVFVEISYWNLKKDALLYNAVIVYDSMGTLVFSSASHTSISSVYDGWYGRPRPVGLFKSVCRIPGNFFNEGLYSVTVVVGKAVADTQIIQKDALTFDVHDTGEMRKEFYGGWGGVIRPRLAWKTEFLGEKSGKKETACY